MSTDGRDSIGPSGSRKGSGSRLLSWQFATLVAVTVVDAVAFAIPVASGGILVAALVAPRSLRRVARFLDDLAGPETD